MAETGSRVIPANEYRRVRWKNGQGWTREIVRAQVGPASGRAAADEDWDLRLSIAEIERDARFSTFPGVERELVLLQGNGLRLRFDDGEVRELRPPHQGLRFSGERPLAGELIDGPSHDFNLMWRSESLAAELHHRPLHGPMLFFTDPDTTWAVHLLSGQASFDAASALPPLAAGDTAMLVGEHARQRFLLDGGGELLAIKLSLR